MIIIFYLNAVFSSGDVGTTMYPLLKIGFGPRPAALGEAYVGLADDISGVWWNPAGLSGIKELQFFVSHQEWFMDFRDEYFILGMPGLSGYLALSGLYSSIKNVEIWDANNEPLGIRNLWSGIFSLAYAQKLRENLSFGFGIKSMIEDLYEQSLYDFALDLGAKLVLNKNFQLGGAIKNLSYKTEIPSEIKLGVCYQGLKQASLLLDLTLPRDNTIRTNLGVEYNINPFFGIRAGWRSGPYNITCLGWGSGFTAGFGLKYSGIKFDYAFVPYGKLGLTHRISLSGGLGFIKGINLLVITIMEGNTKKPLEASITLTGEKKGNFQTDKEGILEFKNVPAGWILINTFVPGYPQNLDSVYIQAEGSFEKVIYLYKVRLGILRGLVFDAVTKRPLGAVVVYKGMALGTIDNDSTTGTFVLKDLPPGKYVLIASGKDPSYIPQSCSLVIEPGKLTEHEFYLIRKRAKIVLKGVNFDTGKADLRSEAYLVLDEAGRILIDNPDIKVELSGHTDPREISTSEFPSNWELSLARAEVVKKYLIEKFNINPDRLIARGYADTQPLAPNTTEEEMAQNRRTEFRIIEE